MKRFAFRLMTFLVALGSGIFAASLVLTETPANEGERHTFEIVVREPPHPEAVILDDQLEVIEEAKDDFSDVDPFKTKLLETGDGFHGDEVNAESGEKWLGLFVESDKSTLRRSTLLVSRVHDEIVDEAPSARTGKSVHVKGGGTAIFLLKHAPGLKEGRVITYFRGKTWEEASSDDSLEYPSESMTSLDKTFDRSFGEGSHRTTLRVIKAKNRDDVQLLGLIVERDGIRQVLHTMRTSYEGERGVAEWLGQTGTLYWVGDLDGDQEPDFYLDLFVHDNVGNKVLYLSSAAGPGQLVKKVARFVTTGC